MGKKKFHKEKASKAKRSRVTVRTDKARRILYVMLHPPTSHCRNGREKKERATKPRNLCYTPETDEFAFERLS